MRKYSKISPQFWTDPDVRKLSNDGKLFLLYLLTSPHQNMVGWHFLNKYYMSGDMGYPIDTVSELLQYLINKGFIHYDWDNEMLLIHKFLKYNSVTGPKQAEGAIKVIDNLPDHTMIQLFRDCVEKYNKDDDKHLLKGIDRVYGTVCDRDGGEPEPEPEPEQEPETDTETDDPANSFEELAEVPDDVQQLAMKTYSHVPEALAQWYEWYSPQWIPEAIKITAKRCKSTPNYTKGILENWREKGGMDINKDADNYIPPGFFKHTDGRILPNDHFKEKKG